MTEAAPRRRALLVGIDTYTPPDQGDTWLSPVASPGRKAFADLRGCVRSARAIAVLLQESFGFLPDDLRMLCDRDATREAILQAIRGHLIAGAGPGDEILFYYCGHGSRVANSLSDEPDLFDESLVPADSWTGTKDLRDKELRRLCNEVLDHGVRLTVILDCCHSGSGARGVRVLESVDLAPGNAEGGSRERVLQLVEDPRDAADGPPYGPRPEDRGALILSASQDDKHAREVADAATGDFYGAFTLALLRAIAAGGPGESAERLFFRAKVILQTSAVLQEPVLAGSRERRRSPLLGAGSTDAAGAPPVAIAKVRYDGGVVLHGGLSNGLRPGCRLTVPLGAGRTVELTVTSVRDPASAEARVVAGNAADLAVGTLCELSGWSVEGGAALAVWIPVHDQWEEARSFALELSQSAAAAGVRWICDPVEEEPGCHLDWGGESWRLTDPQGESVVLGRRPRPADVLARVAAGGPGAGLFVQLPVPPVLARALCLGEGTKNDAIERADHPGEAHYVLVGRMAGGAEYAWVRPAVGPGDSSWLPRRSTWHHLPQSGGRGGGPAIVGPSLVEDALKIARIRSWLILEAPPAQSFPYRLALRRAGDGELRVDRELVEGEAYGLVLCAAQDDLDRLVEPRSVYVFQLDRDGGLNLLFPTANQGGVENRFPLQRPGELPPAEIPLGLQPSFAIRPPLGVDTYFLLTTSDPIPTPEVLEAEPVRRRSAWGMGGPLLQLLASRGGPRRGATSLAPADWSIERLTFTSRPAAHEP
jgi:hypothetical protein